MTSKVRKVIRNDTTGELLLVVDDHGTPRQIALARDEATQLLVALLGLPNPKSGNRVELSPIQAGQVSVFDYPDKTSGLEFLLRGGWSLAIAIPHQAVPGLRQTVESLALLNEPTKGMQ